MCSILKILFRDSVHSCTRENFIAAWLGHWIRKNKDKYNRQDKAVLLLRQSKLYEYLTVLKTVRRYLLVVRDLPVGRSGKVIAYWGKFIILYFICWRMNPPPKEQLRAKILFLKESCWAYSATVRLLSSISRALCLNSLLG